MDLGLRLHLPNPSTPSCVLRDVLPSHRLAAAARALLPTPSGSVGIDAALLKTVEAEASKRGLDAATLLDSIVREALDAE